MKKNILFFTALKANDPNMFDYMEWSIKTWTYYAQKHNCEIFILEDALYDTEWMRPTWQRWHIYDLLKANDIEYNQVALVDIDTMVRWDTPDIFALSENKYSGVRDDVSVEWTCNSITGYKDFFPEVNLEWDNYINNGLLILPTDGEDFCNVVKDFYLTNVDTLRDLQHNSLKKGTDQTPVNYLALQFFGEDRIKYLSKKLNMTHLNATHAFAPSLNPGDNVFQPTGIPCFIKHGYIWHFNALPRDQRNNLMKQTWDIIKENYN